MRQQTAEILWPERASKRSLRSRLAALFDALNAANVRWCVLRNYACLPDALHGRDVDILVGPRDLLTAVRVVQSTLGMTQFASDAYGVSIRADGLQLDFVSSLAWKGQNYFEIDGVLARAKRWKRWDVLCVPDDLDGAVIALLQSCFSTGQMKQPYLEEMSRVCATHAGALAARMPFRVPSISKTWQRLMSQLSIRDYKGAATTLRRVKRQLLTDNFLHEPLFSTHRLCRHYWRQLRNVVASGRVTTVAFVGVDGAGKSTVLAELRTALQRDVFVECQLFRPKVLYDRTPPTPGEYVHPHTRRPHSLVGSCLRATVWCAEYWISKVLTAGNGLQMYDRYFHDLIVDPRRYRYGGPGWFARLLCEVVVEPDLWVLLDASPEVLRGRKPEFDLPETARQRSGYLSTIGRRQSVLVVNAGQSISKVVAEVKAVILNLLERRAHQRLTSHFKLPRDLPVHCDSSARADNGQVA
jgi:thymidylate kinase